MIVLKFGGSCLATPGRIRHACDIMAEAIHERDAVAVVCSAMGGVTNQLIEITGLAANRQLSYRERLNAVANRHLEAVTALFTETRRPEAKATISACLQTLEARLATIFSEGHASLAQLDAVIGFGELLSTQLVAHHLQTITPVSFLDAREVVRTNDHFGHASVDQATTTALVQGHFRKARIPLVTTGFIGRTESGEPTTLGRGGSDYTAALIGAALGCDSIEIWTDVDGFMTADPALVAKATPMRELSFEAASTLAHFGAKVLYEPTLTPARNSGATVVIKNCFAPNHPGTLVHDRAAQATQPLAGLASLETVAQVRLSSSDGCQFETAAADLFSHLAQMEAPVVFAIRSHTELEIYLETQHPGWRQLDHQLRADFAKWAHTSFGIRTDLALVALVGNQSLSPVIVSDAMVTLERAKVPPAAIGHGFAGHALVLALARQHREQIVQDLHARFFEKRTPVAPAMQVLGSTAT